MLSLKINIVVGGRFHATQLFKGLTSLGHDVHIYATSPARYFTGVPSAKVTFFPKPAQLIQKLLKVRAPRWLSELSAFIFDLFVARMMRSADLVWGFNGDSYLAGCRIKSQGGIYICDRACPHILTQEMLLMQEAENVGYPYSPHTRRTLNRFMAEYEIADRIVVPSQYSARSFAKHGITQDRLALAPLDANAPLPLEQSAELICFDGAKPDDILVGMVGGSFLRKGILHLLRAIKAVGRPDIRLVLRANKASILLHPEARQLCKELRVLFVPYLDDINCFYRSVHMFVLPSIDEGFGMVIYEALRNGTPVIATDHVGAIDGMESGRHFLKVSVQNEEALSQAITQLADDPELRSCIGSEGLNFYRSRSLYGSQYQRSLAEILYPYISGD